MADFSLNLPSWAIREGYKVKGEGGTYGSLLLYKGIRIVRVWGYDEPQPNIIEMEDFIQKNESKSKEALSRC